MPDVAAVFSVGAKFVAPGVEFLLQAAAGGVLPFGLGGEAFAAPVGEGCGILPGDVDDWMVSAVPEGCAGTFGLVPAGTRDFAPPWSGRDRVFDEIAESCGRNQSPEDEGPAEAFGFGSVSSGFDELLETIVCDRVAVDREGIESDGADWAFAVVRKALG